MNTQRLRQVLEQAAELYPREMRANQHRDIPRMIFNIGTVLDACAPTPYEQLSIGDIGGGVGLFSLACAKYGFANTVLIDDFDDNINHQRGDSLLDLHRAAGVQVIARDAVDAGLDGIDMQFDAITSFDSMEHWHHSPKRLFEQIMQRLKPGGVFFLGVPNCVNIRKRIAVPLGISSWSGMHEWYEDEKFRGHVREPNVADLHYIARDMGLVDTKIYGRNWLGYYSENPLVRGITSIVDLPLRLRPQLCADIYLLGRKPK